MKKTAGDSRHATLFIKKGKNIQQDIGCKVVIQAVYQALNSLDYSWQLIDGVSVSVWYPSLRLPTQEEIIHHQKRNYEITTGGYFKMKTVIAMKIWYQMFNLTMIVILSRHY